jgi:hypothetical protein
MTTAAWLLVSAGDQSMAWRELPRKMAVARRGADGRADRRSSEQGASGRLATAATAARKEEAVDREEGDGSGNVGGARASSEIAHRRATLGVGRWDWLLPSPACGVIQRILAANATQCAVPYVNRTTAHRTQNLRQNTHTHTHRPQGLYICMAHGPCPCP